jgi:hypothetical protein
MKCSVCEKDFILSMDNNDYLIKKQKLDEDHCNYLEDNIEKNEEGCWIKLMNEEALLLKPNQNPFFCPANICGAMICKYCHDLIKKYYEKTNKCPICMQ